MNLHEVYRAYGEESEAGVLARQLLDQQHWYASIAEFDPKIGDARPLAFDEVLYRIAIHPESTDLRDRLWRIIDHSRMSVEHIFASLVENPRREQAYLPIRDVKELNATSFVALSRRPGRNVREKLAGKPYMQAVRRYQSVDLPQNRLVKEFVTRLAELLELRKECLGHEDVLLGHIYRWLRSDDAQGIGRWENLPPNNTLLSHRDYRRVWDAWRWLQVLDDTIDRDFNDLEGRAATVEKWEGFGRSYAEGTNLFGDMPVLFDYNSFAIEPWQDPVLRGNAGATNRPGRSRAAVDSPACVDLTYLRPRFATSESQVPSTLPEAYLWQRWRREGDSADLELFNADIAVLHPGATSISTGDLFFSRDSDESLLDRAAHCFIRRLSRAFADPALLWLVPDFLNDFQLQVARRNINARFLRAEPLPRSVAAVFEQIEHARIDGDGFQVVVVDQTGGTTYATKLIARYDADLQQRVPQTGGFYWERSPHVTLQHDETSYDALGEITRVDGNGQWSEQTSVVGLQRVSEKALRRHPQVGEFDLCITIPESPVCGGARLQELQGRAGDIPLWRDHIPELSIKVIKDGRYRPFFLVDRDTHIRPIRGVAVKIQVGDLFTLPSGRTHYQFPLFQGQDPDDLGYVARLESPAFPLAADVVCRLEMTYTYGADDPYRLLFVPLDGSFKAVPTKWQPKTEQIVTDAPGPEYPTAQSWSDLRSWHDTQGNEVDVLAWLSDSLDALADRLPSAKSRITIAAAWVSKTDRNGAQYWSTTATANDGRPYRCDSKNFSPRFIDDPNVSLPTGTPLYAILESDWARQISTTDAMSDNDKRRILSFRERSLQNRISVIWSDARSLTDVDCPTTFGVTVQDQFRALIERLPQDLIDQKLLPLFAFMHRDAPTAAVEWITKQVESGAIRNPRAVGSSLGNVETPWQHQIFTGLTVKPSRSAIAALSYAIWRDQSVVEHFSVPALRLVLNNIHIILGSIEPFIQQSNYKDGSRSWARSVGEPLELLLGLLRTRGSSNREIQMLLQPHQDVTKTLAGDVERIAEVAADSRVGIYSRVQMANLPPKPEGDRTPDLLYALRLYLTGDVGANAIRVTGVNDGEDD